MAGTAVLGRLGRLAWRPVEVLEVVPETERVKTLRLDVQDWSGHLPGQHVDVRLTSEDGYQAQRSYSLASPPGSPLELTVELVDDGEVSPYLTEEIRIGDRFELRGPFGGFLDVLNVFLLLLNLQTPPDRDPRQSRRRPALPD